MFARFSLAILFAVLVAVSRPTPSGGAHDLFAVGVRVDTGKRTDRGEVIERLVLATPDREAVHVYDLLLESPARPSLLQGSTVHATAPAAESDPSRLEADRGPRILELVFYGHRSRAGRAPVVFTGGSGDPLPGSAEAWRLARGIAALPGSVTAAAARVLLHSPDDAAFGDALEALADVRADVASAEARAAALPAPGGPPVSSVRRVMAVMVLKRKLGGAAIYPEEFRKLAECDDPLVSRAAR